MNLSLWKMAHSSKPILIGPWSSEVGFEVLYWLPYLTYLREQYALDKARLIVVSRGGSGAWYDVAAQVELYGYAPVEEWRVRAIEASQQTGSIKQNKVTEWERHVLALVAHRLGLTKYHLIHPSLMYRECSAWWNDKQSVRWLMERLRWKKIAAPPLPDDIKLPPQFVAVRFYVRSTWPADEGLILFAQTLVKRLSTRLPVVLLNTGIATDDHADIGILGDNVFSFAEHMTPQNSLAVQSAILGRAQAFMGTYGGLAQLALRMNIPSVSFYNTWQGTCAAHLILSHLLSLQSKMPFMVVRPDEAEMAVKLLA